MPAVLRMSISILVPVVIAIFSYFGVSLSTLASRVDSLQAQSAAQQQATTDIDARLTRIENKLDTALSQAASTRVLH
jgi:cell division protein FtsB